MLDAYSLEGKVAVITGGARGIGWGIASAMSEVGAHVVLAGRNLAALEARVEKLMGAGFKASVIAVDINNHEVAIERLNAVVESFGHLDILVNNAGVNARAPIGEVDSDDWQNIIDTNLTATFALAQAAAAPMTVQGFGRIINIGSIMGSVARPTVAAYAASKGAVAALTRVLAVELGPKGITCNAIAPGYITTDMTADLAADEKFDAFIKSRTPAHRWGTPEDVGRAAAFLATEAAGYINGHVLVVDGGLTAGI